MQDDDFDVNDFDPLNDNAKKIPPVPLRSPVVLPTAPSLMPKPKPNPSFVYRPVQNRFVNNPSYTYHHVPVPPMNNLMPSTTPSPKPVDDENELLRKYGLDRLNVIEKKLNETTLNDNTSNPFAIHGNRNSNRTIDSLLDNGLQKNGDIQPISNNNWTKFD